MTTAGLGAKKGLCEADVATRVSEGEIASRVLDNLELEVIVIDAAGSIQFCNAAARELLSTAKVALSRCEDLLFGDGETNRWLRSVLTGYRPGSGQEYAMLMDRDNPAENRFVSVDRLGETTATSTHFLVTLSRLTGALPAEEIRPLMQHFGLTPAEQRLTLFLSAGGHLMDAAKSFRVSRHTVRNQLRSIFDKVGVRRQSELTHLMCRGPQIRAFA